MPLRQKLIEARALIDTPEKLLQNGLYSDGKGCFCSLGALFQGDAYLAGARALKSAIDVPIPKNMSSIPWFNDNHTHAEVMAMWDRAIEGCEDV